MTLTNRDVFAIDPTESDIPNLGVAKVKNPEDAGDWATLSGSCAASCATASTSAAWSGSSTSFLSHLSQAEQPAVWVSGFYGSGKSHLVRVLEYLWRDSSCRRDRRSVAHDAPVGDRGSPHGAVDRRQARRWAVVGSWDARVGRDRVGAARVPLGPLRRAGLPEQYRPGPLHDVVQQEGHLDAVRAAVEAKGKDLRERDPRPLRLAGDRQGAARRRCELR